MDVTIDWPDRNTPRQFWTPQHLEINGYTYTFRDYGMKKKKRAFYRCLHGSRSSNNPCPAVLIVDFSNDGKTYSWTLVNSHTCSPWQNEDLSPLTEVDIRCKISELYFRNDIQRQPHAISIELLKWLNEESKKSGKTYTVSQNYVRNCVHQLNELNPINKISFDNCETIDHQKFLLFCVRVKDKPIYGFASPFMLEKVRDCEIVGIDGTFHAAPSNSYQVCVFMGMTHIMNLPLLYIILPNKKEKSYICAFEAYLSALNSCGISFLNDTKFICDFEVGEINAIKKVFLTENQTIQLCYFHFTKSIYERIEYDPFIYDLFNVIKLLPFIDIKTTKKFISFISTLKISEKVEKFISYFVDTYSNRFKIEDWNVTSKKFPNRATNNVNERFNKTLNSKIGKSPTILNFLVELTNLEYEYRLKYENLVSSHEKFESYYLNDIDRNEIIENFCNGIMKLRKNPEFDYKVRNQEESFFGLFQDGPFETVEFNVMPSFVIEPKYENEEFDD